MKLSSVFQALAAFALSGLSSFVSAQGTIVDIASADPDTFSTLVTALGEAGLVETLSSEGPFTVFAPTNDAFDRLPAGVLEYLLANTDVLAQVLTYHVLPAEVLSSSISNGDTAATVQGESVKFRSRRYFNWNSWRVSRRLYVNDARITTANVDASNGVIHVISEVLIPEDLDIPLDIVDTAIDAGLHTLVRAVEIAELVDTLRSEGPFTVLAPTDEAFRNLPDGVLKYLVRNPDMLSQVLLYHVVAGAAVPAASILDGSVPEAETAEGSTITLDPVEGTTVTINNGEATVVIADVGAANGIAHVIDSVLVPPTLVLPPSIVETAVSLPDTFSTLVTALTEADLVDALSGDGPFTVFAPTNEAFAALGDDTLNSLLADPMGELRDILKYHVLSTYVTAEDIIDKAPATARTLNRGRSIDISVVDGMVKINENTTVTDPDVVALNGVIHIIDQVLLPPDEPECPYPRWVCRWLGYH